MSFIFEHWFEDEPADITRGELKRIMNSNDTEKKQVCHEDKMNVLEKIRAEIIDTGAYEQETKGQTEFLRGINYCLSIIDEYIAESKKE